MLGVWAIILGDLEEFPRRTPVDCLTLQYHQATRFYASLQSRLSQHSQKCLQLLWWHLHARSTLPCVHLHNGALVCLYDIRVHCRCICSCRCSCRWRCIRICTCGCSRRCMCGCVSVGVGVGDSVYVDVEIFISLDLYTYIYRYIYKEKTKI